jgi:hypothetical protein
MTAGYPLEIGVEIDDGSMMEAFHRNLRIEIRVMVRLSVRGLLTQCARAIEARLGSRMLAARCVRRAAPPTCMSDANRPSIARIRPSCSGVRVTMLASLDNTAPTVTPGGEARCTVRVRNDARTRTTRRSPDAGRHVR